MPMKFSELTKRIVGAEAWEVHYDALARQEAGEDIILLSVGQETERTTPAPIVDAAIASLQRGRHHYTPVEGNIDLRQAIAKHHFEQTGQSVDASNCVVFAGAQNALFSVAQCLLEKGDEVILSEPYYTTYPATFGASGAALICVPVQFENGFHFDPDALIAAMTPRTRAVVLNSPNNPLGLVYTQEHYNAIVEACVERDIWLINDNVYQELLFDSERVSWVDIAGAERVCISICSLSKSHRMTGWRVGWVVGPPPLMTHLYNLALCMIYGLPPFIQDAAVVALASGNVTAREVRANLDRRHKLALQELEKEHNLKLFGTEGGMFMIFDIRQTSLSAQEFARGLLDRFHVSVLPCDGFGQSCVGLLRISLCVEDDHLKTACDRIRAYLKTLREE